MSTDGTDRTSLLIGEIGTLAVVPPGPLAGPAMRDVHFIYDAALLIRDGRIAWFGPDGEAPLDEGTATLSAGGGCVIPGVEGILLFAERGVGIADLRDGLLRRCGARLVERVAWRLKPVAE